MQEFQEYRNALNNILKAIYFDDGNPNYFGDFIGVFQTRPRITSYQDKIQHPALDKPRHPTLDNVAYVDSHPLKGVLIENGSTINAIFSVSL